MGRVAAVATLVLLAAPIALGDPVTVTVHAYAFVRAPEDLMPKCGADPAIRGCTRFFGRKLTGACSADANGWLIEPLAEYGMLTFVFDRNVIAHEMKHIAEIRFDVEDYVAAVRTQRFESLDACTAALRETESGFPRVMDSLQWKSNSKRHAFAEMPISLTAP